MYTKLRLCLGRKDYLQNLNDALKFLLRGWIGSRTSVFTTWGDEDGDYPTSDGLINKSGRVV